MLFDSTNFKRPNDPSAGSANEPADFKSGEDGSANAAQNSSNSGRKVYYDEMGNLRRNDQIGTEKPLDLKSDQKKPSTEKPEQGNKKDASQKNSKVPSGGSKIPTSEKGVADKAIEAAEKKGGTASNVAKIGKAAQTLQRDDLSAGEKAKEVALDTGTAAAGEVLAGATGDVINITRIDGKIYVVFFEMFKIRLATLAVIQVLWWMWVWGLMLVYFLLTVAVVCQETDYKVLGVSVVHKTAGVISGLDVEGVCKPLQEMLSGITGIVSSTLGGGGNGGYAGGSCEVVNNPASGCDVNKLTGVCTWDPKLASQVCNKESAGGMNPAIGGQADFCYVGGPDGKKLPMSIGYFQLNIFNSTGDEFVRECYNVLHNDGCYEYATTKGGTRYCKKRNCSFGPKGEAGYNECVRALSDPVRNTRRACSLYKDRGWQPWQAARECKIIN